MTTIGIFTLVGAASGAVIGSISGAIWSVARKDEQPPPVTKPSPPMESVVTPPLIQFDPNSNIRPPSLKPIPMPDALTLRWLFTNESPQLWIQSIRTTITDSNGVHSVQSQIYMDFPGRSRFVGFYIRPGNTYEDCIVLPDVIDPLISYVRENFSIKSGTLGASDTQFDDLLSTGRVYIYHEDSLNLQQRAKIELLFNTKHLGVIFRGPDWLMFQLQAMRKK